MIRDDHGLIVGRREDPGDSLHRYCMYMLGSAWFHNVAPKVMDLLKYNIGGKWVRHPSDGWWSDVDRLSRDQATPLVICLGEFFNGALLWEFFIAHVKRGFFFTNTRRNGATKQNHKKFKYGPHHPDYFYDYSWKLPDVIGPEFLGLYIRSFRWWFLYPVLLLSDLELLIGSILWQFKDDETDILNHIIVREYAVRVYPTPISRLARRINKRSLFKPKLDYYFDRVGLPEMASLWDKSL